jgi:hypothetical protein
MWKDVPQTVRDNLKLTSPRVDNGIDIVAQMSSQSGYVAVQCKYRKNIKQTVTWTSLSTFVGLCAVTGPWDRHLLMTNCRGVTRKVPKTPKDFTIAYGSFCSNFTWDKCLKINGQQNKGQLIGERINQVSNDDIDMIRAIRLSKFGLDYNNQSNDT